MLIQWRRSVLSGAAALHVIEQANDGRTVGHRAFPTCHVSRGGRVVGQVQGADRGGLRALVDAEARLLAPLEGVVPPLRPALFSLVMPWSISCHI